MHGLHWLEFQTDNWQEESGDMGMYYRQEFAEEHKQLEKSFFQCDAVMLARRLLGKFLYNTDCAILRITEVNNWACLTSMVTGI